MDTILIVLTTVVSMFYGYTVSNKEPLSQLLERIYGTGACHRYFVAKYGE